MLNQAILVGRLTKDVEVIETDGKTRSYITLAVQRPYKNADGEYDTDFIDCVLWNSVAENTAEYCHKGDIVGVKGRIETFINNEEKKVTQIVAEKITFLSTKKNED